MRQNSRSLNTGDGNSSIYNRGKINAVKNAHSKLILSGNCNIQGGPKSKPLSRIIIKSY